MRILQLIDSLDTGGSERVAVNLANALSFNVEGSYLCASRKEGLLKKSITKNVNNLFLNKQKTIDLKAISALSGFVKENKINIIHAHSTSFFLAIIIKFLNKNVSVVWHDHYGNSEFLEHRKFRVLKFCSTYFSHIFSVNKVLETWAKQNLKTKKVTYLPNFATIDENIGVTKLNGVSGKRIVCLANLRPQKDHFTLFKAFKSVVELYPDWTLHCVGKDFGDRYSEEITSELAALGIAKSVFIYGSKPDVFNILRQCEIGVLSSKSEGLPIALLEYGLANLAVITTNVGECKNVIHDKVNGFLINSLDVDGFVEALIIYIENEALRNTHSSSYKKHIKENYSEKAQLENILEIYKNCIK